MASWEMSLPLDLCSFSFSAEAATAPGGFGGGGFGGGGFGAGAFDPAAHARLLRGVALVAEPEGDPVGASGPLGGSGADAAAVDGKWLSFLLRPPSSLLPPLSSLLSPFFSFSSS